MWAHAEQARKCILKPCLLREYKYTPRSCPPLLSFNFARKIWAVTVCSPLPPINGSPSPPALNFKRFLNYTYLAYIRLLPLSMKIKFRKNKKSLYLGNFQLNITEFIESTFLQCLFSVLCKIYIAVSVLQAVSSWKCARLSQVRLGFLSVSCFPAGSQNYWNAALIK